MTRILIIEDDAELQLGLRDNLEIEGYQVLTAADGEAGLDLAVRERPDLIVLDLMLPRMSGFDVCRAIRSRQLGTPILILTARSHESDKVAGLELGADDYVTKPFSIHELVARIRALIRRQTAPPRRDAVQQFGDLELRAARRELLRGHEVIGLSTLEVQVLSYLAAREGEVVSREQLLRDVWGYKSDPTTRSVDNLMARLRHKLEADPHSPTHLLTVHGTGYKFVA